MVKCTSSTLGKFDSVINFPNVGHFCRRPDLFSCHQLLVYYTAKFSLGRSSDNDVIIASRKGIFLEKIYILLKDINLFKEIGG
jgi:hypothetical protein